MRPSVWTDLSGTLAPDLQLLGSAHDSSRREFSLK